MEEREKMDGGTGPGVGVRVTEGEGSPLDKTWQLLKQAENGTIVEDPPEENDSKKKEGAIDGQSETMEEERRGEEVEREEKKLSSSGRPNELFEAGSMVEVKGYGYGVVQWVGQVAGQPTAGVELEVYSEKGGDGTPEGGNHPLFPCNPGYAVFTPVRELDPDARFMTFEPPNPLAEVELETVMQKVEVPKHTLYSQDKDYSGIQGEHNSCYIDATLFGLFALSSDFDYLLNPCQGNRGNEGSVGENLNPCQGNRGNEGSVGEEICSTLLTKIINPLRKNGIVRCEPVLELREQLDSLGKLAGLKQDEKDPEEFLNLLFKHALSADPFISIQRPQGVEQEFFVQLFVEPDPSLSLPYISKLLHKTFSEQKIQFSEVPDKLLIQVPRYGRQFKMFNRVIPDKQLYFRDLCLSSSLSLGDNKELNAHLRLLSVVCIETSHYVCFTFDDSHWIFSDSMADRIGNSFNIPKCKDCTELLEEWVYGDGHQEEMEEEDGKKLPELVRRFTQDVYMCVYVEDSTAV